jgi:ribosomal protein L16 Arg81 hydroxylase
MTQRNGYLFLSSPSAVTPVHFDSEHNLLLQIRGSKEVSISEFADERARHQAIDRHWDRKQPDFTSMAAQAKHYQLQPGEGVYMAPFLPHWVENGPGVSISLSIPFYTEVAQRAEHVNKVNARLRRAHIRPRPVGQSESLDKAKAGLYRSGLKIREVVSKR